jgi:hypothetical protein
VPRMNDKEREREAMKYDNKQMVLDFLREQGRSKANTLAAHIDGTMGDAIAALNALTGKVEQTGSGYYGLTEKYRAELDHPLAHDPDKRLLNELLAHYQEHGWLGRVTLSNWLGVPPVKVRELQQALVKKRMLRLDKTGRFALVRKRSAAA